MKFLLFTRALACAPYAGFEAADRQTARALRTASAPRLRCVWSRDADGRLVCRWQRDDDHTDGTIPLTAIRRFPLPVSPNPVRAPLRTPTRTRVTDLRRTGDLPTQAPNTENRPAPVHNPRAPEGTGHVRHVRPA